MASPTIFIALQCCQCSTMQVKQRKKSSNKWVCSVCNQKQSVRKVFAQGYMAKDLRKFVQNFNMSRKVAADQQEQALLFDETQIPTSVDQTHIFEQQSNHIKIRSNWIEYLDQEDQRICSYSTTENQRGEGDECEPRVVTEFSVDMFKKPRMEKYSSGLESSEGRNKKLFKHVFTKKSTELFASLDKEPVEKHAHRSSKRRQYISQEDVEAPKIESGSGKVAVASKWIHYVSVEDDGDGNGNMQIRDTRSYAENEGPWCNGVLEAMTNDECVEDDIHPDFL